MKARVLATQHCQTHAYNDATKRYLSVSLNKLGEVAVAQGDLASAKRYFQQSYEIAEKLAEDEQNAQAQRDLSISLEKLGEVAVAQGDLAGAKRYFGQSCEIREKLAEDEQNAQAQRDLSVSLNNLGDVAVAQGDLAGAKRYFGQSCEIREKLAEDEHNALAQRDQAVSLERLAKVASAERDYATAGNLLKRELAIAESLLARSPDTADIMRFTAIVHGNLGDVALARGDLAGAKRSFQKSHEVLEKLAEDMHNAQAQRDLAVSLEKQAKAASAERDYSTAGNLLKRELAIAESLLARSPESADMMRFTAEVHGMLREVALGRQQPDEASRQAAEALRLLDRMKQRSMHLSPSDEQWRKQLQAIVD